MEPQYESGPVTADVLQHDTISSWLRKHGKSVRPRLDRRQLNALRECFDIIDTDGTGIITAEELQEVFKVAIKSFSKHAALQHKPGIRQHRSALFCGRRLVTMCLCKQ